MKTKQTKQIDPIKANAERWSANEDHARFMCQVAMDMMAGRKRGVTNHELRAAFLRFQRAERQVLKLFIKCNDAAIKTDSI